VTFVGLSSAPICVIHNISFHEGFLRLMLRMMTVSRRTKLLTHGSSLSITFGIRLGFDSSLKTLSLRLTSTRSGVVIVR
jgi:hypothetical protein